MGTNVGKRPSPDKGSPCSSPDLVASHHVDRSPAPGRAVTVAEDSQVLRPTVCFVANYQDEILSLRDRQLGSLRPGRPELPRRRVGGVARERPFQDRRRALVHGGGRTLGPESLTRTSWWWQGRRAPHSCLRRETRDNAAGPVPCPHQRESSAPPAPVNGRSLCGR